MIKIYLFEKKKIIGVLFCLLMSDFEMVFQINGLRYYELSNEVGVEVL